MFATSCICENSSKTGVLLCPPFGGERQRVYRSTFLFACALAEQGIPSLRFDYCGIGDSDGDLPSVSMDSMLDDVLVVARDARQILGVEKLVFLGIRLGAVLAIKAASQIDWADTCVVWNPVINGKNYLRELVRIEKIIHLTGKRSREEQKKSASGLTELEADFIGSEMEAQLKAVDLMSGDFSVSSLFVTGVGTNKREASGIDTLVAAHCARIPKIETWLEQPREYWSATSMYDAYFPTPTFEATINWIKENVE